MVRLTVLFRDQAIYDPSQEAAVTSADGPVIGGKGIPMNLTLGPSFFEGFKQLPAQWVFGIPFIDFNKTNSRKQAELFVRNAGISQIQALEIGNEPDLYKAVAHDAVVPPSAYVSKWHDYASNIRSDISGLRTPIWQALCLARAEGHDPLTLAKILQAGVLNNAIKSISMHYYQKTTSTGFEMQHTLLNHKYIKSGLAPHIDNVRYLRHNGHPDLEYVLGETGRYPVDRNAQPSSMADANFGSALWTVDMMLYAMSQNISRINMQQGVEMGFAAWHPIKAGKYAASVTAPFYAQVFVADVIGKENNTRIVELKTTEEGNGFQEFAAAYAIYNSGGLSKIAIVNLQRYVANGTDSVRPQRTFKLNKLPSLVQGATIKKLSGPGSEALNNVSYGGKQWLVENHGKETTASDDDTVHRDITGNSLTLQVDDSQAVLVVLERGKNIQAANQEL